MGKLRALAGLAIAAGVVAGTWSLVTPSAPEETGGEPDDGEAGGDGNQDREELLRAIEDMALELKSQGADPDRVEELLAEARQRTESELSEIRSELREIRGRLDTDPAEPDDRDDNEPSEPQQE